jgi:hypothetical protein
MSGQGVPVGSATRHTIALDTGRCKGATPEQMDRIMGVAEMAAEWADILRIHHDTVISVCFDGAPSVAADKQCRIKYDAGSGTWLMRCDMDRAQYHKYRIYCSPLCLAPKRDESRELDVIHELLHIRLYDYTQVAEALCGEDNAELLQQREEGLVVMLEHAFGGIYELREV